MQHDTFLKKYIYMLFICSIFFCIFRSRHVPAMFLGPRRCFETLYKKMLNANKWRGTIFAKQCWLRVTAPKGGDREFGGTQNLMYKEWLEDRSKNTHERLKQTNTQARIALGGRSKFATEHPRGSARTRNYAQLKISHSRKQNSLYRRLMFGRVLTACGRRNPDSSTDAQQEY